MGIRKRYVVKKKFNREKGGGEEVQKGKQRVPGLVGKRSNLRG